MKKSYKLLLLVLILPTLLFTACSDKKEATENKEQSTEQVVETFLFIPNEMLDDFDIKPVVIKATPENIVNALIKENALPENVSVNKFVLENDNGKTKISIDLTEEFSDKVLTLGTTGEYMIFGSLANTFLWAYDAESLYVTCNGEIIETGHSSYDYPIEFVEIEKE